MFHFFYVLCIYVIMFIFHTITSFYSASKHTARKQKAELEAMTSQVLELEAALNRKVCSADL